MDDVLPNTNIRYRIDSSECASGPAVEKAVQQAILPQDGYGKVVAVVGATCSGASMAAANLLEIFKKPLISGSSTNPTLSDSDKYPFFMRTVPSDLAQGEGLGHLAEHLNATRMGVITGDGAYPMGISKEFRSSAQLLNGVTVPTTAFETITKQTNVDGGDGKEYVNADLSLVCKMDSLHKEGMRHYLFSMHDPDVHYIAATSVATGLLDGDEYMYYAVDSWATTKFEYLEGGTHVRGWWYNSENLGGFWAIRGSTEWGGRSASGAPGKLVPLEDINGNLQSISLDGGCKTISGTLDGENVVLDGRSGKVTATSSDSPRLITWGDGSVWEQVPPPTLADLQNWGAGSMGLITYSEGANLPAFVEDIWKGQASRYDYDTRNVYAANFKSDSHALGWADTDGDRDTVHAYGPCYFDAAVTVALALDAVIKEGGDVNDGELVHQKMLSTAFEGMSGPVRYLQNGDRFGTQYSLTSLGPAGMNIRKAGLMTLGVAQPLTFFDDVSLYYRQQATKAFQSDGSCGKSPEGDVCYGRGTCTFGPGTCSCEAGFTGDACQSAVVVEDEGGMSEGTKRTIIGVCVPIGLLLLAYLLNIIFKRYFSHAATAHIFISYKHSDKEVADKVRKELQKQGNKVWIDTQITPGEDWKGEIANAIKGSVGVVFLASKEALESRYCREEILFASSINKPVFTLLQEDCIKHMKGGVKMVLMRKQFVDIKGENFADGMEKCSSFITAIRRGEANKVDMGKGRKQSLSSASSSVGKSKKNIVFVQGATVEEVEEETEASDIVIVPATADTDVAKTIGEQFTTVGVKVCVTAREGHSEGSENVEVDNDMYVRNAAMIKKTQMILFLETNASMKSSECNDEIFYAYEQTKPILRVQIAQDKETVLLSGSMAMMLTVSEMHRITPAGLKGEAMAEVMKKALKKLFAIEKAKEDKTDGLSALQKFQQTQVARGRRISNAITPIMSPSTQARQQGNGNPGTSSLAPPVLEEPAATQPTVEI